MSYIKKIIDGCGPTTDLKRSLAEKDDSICDVRKVAARKIHGAVAIPLGF
jgi:hypothetical protein